MLINEYVNSLFGTNFGPELNKEAIKFSMALAESADDGCLLGQCHPDLWNFICKMNETSNYEIADQSYIKHDKLDYFYFKNHLIKAYEISASLKNYNSKDDMLYIYACNPKGNMYYIGCSLETYFSKFSKYFNEIELRINLLKVLGSKHELYSNDIRCLVKNYFNLKGTGINEVYVCVNTHLDGCFVAPNPVYPFHHMWCAYSPWRLVDELSISNLLDLKMLPMKYLEEYVVAKENEKHVLNIKIVKGNIVDFDTDAIVNAANKQLKAGGGVCGAIFNAAGYNKLTKACNDIGYCKTGEAVITDSFELKSKYIIHTVGPIYRDDSSAKYLKKAYYNTLKLADNYCCKTIAIPSISTGIYGYPKEKAVKIAMDQMINYHAAVLEEVTVVCFDDETFELYNNELKRQERLNKIKGCLLGGAMGDAS